MSKRQSMPGYAVWLVCLLYTPWTAAAPLHHDLKVVLHPDTHSIEIRDTITLPDGAADSLVFSLHPELLPELSDQGARLTALPALKRSSNDPGIVPKRYRLQLAAGTNRFSLHYRGNIRSALQQTAGIISPQSVFLSSATFWYPHIDTGLITFDLDIQLPAGWRGMSQGERLRHEETDSTVNEQWHCPTPQQEIYLVAGPYSEYQKTAHKVKAMVLLYQPDPPLAQKYLDTTHQYIELYQSLIGRYPFSKFAMVENVRETGYGMPSFTLLGSKVIRFPFILHSSYPHEILHNWWGNSVYVDYRSGNWAEGLTSYLADHLIREQHGQGVDYRRSTLQKYTDYVSQQDDFPLTEFRGRHSARTEAVGYGKTLMFFHMLRRQLGDARFIAGLQSFYDQYRFRVADFTALQEVYSTTAGQALNDFFSQWVERTGAPQLRVSRATATVRGDGYHLSAVIEQTQPASPYVLQVPVAVHMDGVSEAYQTEIPVSQRRVTLELDLPARPLRLDVDPEFDIFRRLHRNEIPPAVSQAMGAERVMIVLPAQAAAEMRQAYQALADAWPREKPGQLDVVFDDALKRLPDDRGVWLFGWNNRFRSHMQQALQAYDFDAREDRVRIEHTTLTPETHSFAVLGRHPQNSGQALGWLVASSADALPGLGRKLPHYGRYSYLAFTGTAPDNVLKGQWPVMNSPMSVTVVQDDGVKPEFSPARLAPRKALVAAGES